MKKYSLEVTEKQSEVLCAALEMYSRVQTGQFWAMAEPWYFNHDNHRQLYDALDALKPIIFPELPHNGYHGIHSPKVADEAQMAWDIQQVIRHRLAWDKTPEGGIGVSFHDPLLSGLAPAAKIKGGAITNSVREFCPCHYPRCPESRSHLLNKLENSPKSCTKLDPADSQGVGTVCIFMEGHSQPCKDGSEY
jgi:hypothetical protein